MQCPKCHTKIKDNETVCPKCHKVLLLECPNCKSLGETSVCNKCGYTILTKCSKCGKSVPVTKEICKCGFPTRTSVAYQECESDEFASIVVEFGSLKTIKKLLKSQELYTKFYFKLKNLLFAQVKGVDCKFITYNNIFVINLNKELSLATSSNKAVRLALKIMNAFVSLNSNIIEELSIPLNLTLKILKKNSENLQELTIYNNNVKPLVIKNDTKRYLKGLQIVLDQYICDHVNKEYKTDSVYSLEENGNSIMFYEIVLDSYVLPPSIEKDESTLKPTNVNTVKNEEVEEKDIYSFKVFDIGAKCQFEKTCATELFNQLTNKDLSKDKIISIKTKPEYGVLTSDLVKFYEKCDYNVLLVTCTEEMTYKPWGVFEVLFKEYFNISFHSRFIELSQINPNSLNIFRPLFDLILGKPLRAMSPEDARFAYMELWGKFFSTLSNTVIIIDGFENFDDTSIQTLELYFDKFKAIKPNFVFVTSTNLSVPTKFKALLRTSIYTEYSLQKTSIDSCLATLKSDATDFIQSFYYEKIKENFKGSFLYFQQAIQYLKDTGVLIDFDNKLIIKNKKSVMIPKDLQGLYKSRIKYLSKNIDVSFILAYASILGSRLDLKTLVALGVNEIDKNIKLLFESKLVRFENEIIYINNFGIVAPVITASLKKEAENFLCKNIIAHLGKGLDDTNMALIMGRMGLFKEEYLTLWKNAQFAIKVGDYDAYLKNCLGFLSLVGYIGTNIPNEDIEENKKDVYNNILMYLYSYSPEKIYFIENVLLLDAIQQGEDEKIIKLSNLMLQGALVSSNYKDASGLLHNILSRMHQPTLKIDGVINTKFLLLLLVKIEVLYNIGDFRQCVDLAEEILSAISIDNVEQIKPASFSTSLFVSHILETMRLVGFAKLYLLDEDIEEFFEKIKQSLGVELPEKDCILAIKDFLQGKVYNTGNIEEYSAFSKVIFLILQEISALNGDYNRFAQNIYQAKLLANDIHQRELEWFCELLIAYAYLKIGIKQKAESIYKDVLAQAEKSAMFNLILIAKYFLVGIVSSRDEALLLVNDSLAALRKYDNKAKIMYALFEKLYIEMAKIQEIPFVDIDSEEQKLVDLKDKLVVILN